MTHRRSIVPRRFSVAGVARRRPRGSAGTTLRASDVPRTLESAPVARACARVRAVAVGEAGQSTVELVALLPIIAVVAAAAFAVLSARSAEDQAVAAAQAGAMALLQDADPRQAARAALPASVRPRASIGVAGRRVRVTIAPDGPLRALAGSLTASSTADAGPEPTP